MSTEQPKTLNIVIPKAEDTLKKNDSLTYVETNYVEELVTFYDKFNTAVEEAQKNGYNEVSIPVGGTKKIVIAYIIQKVACQYINVRLSARDDLLFSLI